jgi:hypothetical protein
VRAEIAQVERHPVPSDDLADRIKNYVDALASRAQPVIKGIAPDQALQGELIALHSEGVATVAAIERGDDVMRSSPPAWAVLQI